MSVTSRQPSISFFVLCILTLLSLLVPLLSSCAYRETPGIIAVPPGDYPFFVDDASFDGLRDAVDRHLIIIEQNRETITAPMSDFLSATDLAESLTTFKQLIDSYPDPIQLNRLIRENFTIYQSTGRNEQGDMLVTGYYEPLFQGNLSKTGPYQYPLYRVPDSLIRQSQKKVGRIDQTGRFMPFWTRQDIDSAGVIEGAELVYLKDRLDAYLLHVQGSGNIQLPDGSIRAVHFAASNGHGYNSLGKLFVDEKLMKKADVSIDSIRSYFDEHPEEIDRMLFHNPRYIFFKWGDNLGARGSFGHVLTASRSIAIDHDALPSGSVGYLVTQRPVLDENGNISHWRPFGRFVVPQDSGSAIRGPGRVDLFMGSGSYAAKAAGTMSEPGKLYFLLPKKEPGKPL